MKELKSYAKNPPAGYIFDHVANYREITTKLMLEIELLATKENRSELPVKAFVNSMLESISDFFSTGKDKNGNS
ncbi:hypothetical protein VPAG_00038 [Vibrio phage douglas 12A4]|uniref:hypothetical protein n=1 Tax=Vibrio phage douglas 12A4 TaxID=573171 RepID=UPI0002C0F7C7|nr:hypothetical protein VPAG_00038 [Vibrio phage douglas 12A4]AGG58074.1 hypothetical protein VPAG_00038 [Vibrio phage douglas 12A4]